MRVQILLQFVLAIGCCPMLQARAQDSVSDAARDAAQVKQKLDAYEDGTMTLEQVTGPSRKWCEEVVAYYHSHTNDIPVKIKLPVSRCFVVLGDYAEAARLATEYVGVYSNDYHGWRILGGANFVMKSYNAAIQAYTNAARLGDERNYAGLGMAALKENRLDILHDIVVPKLLVLKDDTHDFPKTERLQMRQVLVAYSINVNEKEVFLRALQGMDINDIVSQTDLKDFVQLACANFQGKDIDKIREELKAVEGSGSNSADSNRPTLWKVGDH